MTSSLPLPFPTSPTHNRGGVRETYFAIAPLGIVVQHHSEWLPCRLPTTQHTQHTISAPTPRVCVHLSSSILMFYDGFCQVPWVFSPIHHDLPFLLVRSHNNTKISITLTRKSYLTDQYDFNLDAYYCLSSHTPFYHCLIVAYSHQLMDMSIQQLFLITPLCPFATRDLGGVTSAPPI